jgi:hypothetical protein
VEVKWTAGPRWYPVFCAILRILEHIIREIIEELSIDV